MNLVRDEIGAAQRPIERSGDAVDRARHLVQLGDLVAPQAFENLVEATEPILTPHPPRLVGLVQEPSLDARSPGPDAPKHQNDHGKAQPRGPPARLAKDGREKKREDEAHKDDPPEREHFASEYPQVLA